MELEAAVNRVSELRRRNTAALSEGSAGIGQLIDALVESSGQFQSQGSGPAYGQDGRLKQNTSTAVLFDGRA